MEEKTSIRLSRNDDRAAASSVHQQVIGVEPQTALDLGLAVACKAVGVEDGMDLRGIKRAGHKRLFHSGEGPSPQGSGKIFGEVTFTLSERTPLMAGPHQYGEDKGRKRGG